MRTNLRRHKLARNAEPRLSVNVATALGEQCELAIAAVLVADPERVDAIDYSPLEGEARAIADICDSFPNWCKAAGVRLTAARLHEPAEVIELATWLGIMPGFLRERFLSCDLSDLIDCLNFLNAPLRKTRLSAAERHLQLVSGFSQ